MHLKKGYFLLEAVSIFKLTNCSQTILPKLKNAAKYGICLICIFGFLWFFLSGGVLKNYMVNVLVHMYSSQLLLFPIHGTLIKNLLGEGLPNDVKQMM